MMIKKIIKNRIRLPHIVGKRKRAAPKRCLPFTFCVDISLSANPSVDLTENGRRKRTVDFSAVLSI